MINMFSITRVFLFTNLITIIFANVVPNGGLYNSFGQQIPPTTVQSSPLSYFPTTPQSWPQGNQPAYFANQPTYPTAPTAVFPTAPAVFNSVKPTFSTTAQLQQIAQGFQYPSTNQNQRLILAPISRGLLMPILYNGILTLLGRTVNAANNNVIQTPTVSPSYNQQLQLYNQHLQSYNNQQPQAKVQPNLQDEILQQHQQQAIQQHQLINDERKMRVQLADEMKRRVQLIKLQENNEELENRQNVKEETEQETSQVQEEKEKEEKEKEEKEKEEEKRVENIRKLLKEKELIRTKRNEEVKLKIKRKNQHQKKPESTRSQSQQPNPTKRPIRVERRHFNSKPSTIIPTDKTNSLVLEN